MQRKIGVLTASAIVVANMIGTGVFTSIGFQLSAVQNTWSILFLWIAGGFIALAGAFSYAELGTHFKESGGDYIYLSRIFHPLLGYLSAWAGLIAGFSAPVALAAIAFTKYMSPFGLQGSLWPALVLIILTGLFHSFTLRHSGRFQNISTMIKVGFILVLIVTGLLLPAPSANAILLSGSWKEEMLTAGYAVSMVYVAFAYTGWNAAAYVVDEIHDPGKNLPRALIVSTLFVSVVYVLFQWVLLRHASVTDLQGKEEVTFIAFNNLLGQSGGKWVSVFIAVQLIATISSYLWVGPRVTWAMSNEYRLWHFFSKRNPAGIPVPAVWLHVTISVIMTLTGSFEHILLYAGFILQLMGSLTVATSLFLKNQKGKNFRSPLKPALQIIFLLFNTWVLLFMLYDRPLESLIGAGILIAGAVFYIFDRRKRVEIKTGD